MGEVSLKGLVQFKLDQDPYLLLSLIRQCQGLLLLLLLMDLKLCQYQDQLQSLDQLNQILFQLQFHLVPQLSLIQIQLLNLHQLIQIQFLWLDHQMQFLIRYLLPNRLQLILSQSQSLILLMQCPNQNQLLTRLMQYPNQFQSLNLLLPDLYRDQSLSFLNQMQFLTRHLLLNHLQLILILIQLLIQ